MADRVKVYEEGTKKSIPILAWLLPLLLLLALLAYFLTRHKAEPAAVSTPATQVAPVATALPDLGTVHFDTDKATLTPEGQATLQQAAAAMKSDPNVHLRLEGYTDRHRWNLAQPDPVAAARDDRRHLPQGTGN